MAITHVGTESAIDAGTTTTLTVNLTAGAAGGDVAVAYMCSDDDNVSSVPTGFTEIANFTFNSDARLIVGYRVLGASEPSSYDFTKADNEDAAGAISVFNGVDNSQVLDTSSSTNTGDSNTPTALSITTVSDDCAILAIGGGEDGDFTWTPPTGMTEIIDIQVGSGASGATMSLGWVIQNSAGATGNKQFTTSGADTWGAVLIALTPSANIVNTAPSIETANAVTSSKVVTIGLADSTEVANSVTPQQFRIIAVGVADEVDTAFTLGQTLKVYHVGISDESDVGLSVSPVSTSFVVLGIAVETNTAFNVIPSGLIDINVASDTSNAFAITANFTQRVAVGTAQESVVANKLVAPAILILSVAVEEDSALKRFIPATPWPETLPQELLLEGLELEFSEATDEEGMDSGPSYRRPLGSGANQPLAGSLWLTTTQHNTLLVFYRDALAHGSLRFRWKHPITRQDAYMRFVVGEEPIVVARAGTKIKVEMQLEILPDAVA